MKIINSIFKFFQLVLIGSLALSLSLTKVHAQDIDLGEYDFTFNLKTVKNADNSRTLSVDFYAEADRDKYPVYGAEIKFYNVLEDETILLGTSKTTEEGIAQLTLKGETTYLKDEDGYITFQAAFEGTDQLDAFEAETSVIDLKLSMELNEDEDGKSITLYANAINGAGEEVPIEESDVYVYVQGMLTKLKIEDGWIEEGEYSFDFPKDLPGDKDGNLTIYARIEDNDDYGNVLQSVSAQWGVGPIINPEKTRKLWTDLGPEWMIVALSVLLVAVWANIVHTIYHLVKIKQEGKRLV